MAKFAFADFVQTMKQGAGSRSGEGIQSFFYKSIPLLLGFLLPGAVFFQSCAPFGIAFFAVGDRKKRNVPLLIATTLGYLFFYRVAFPTKYFITLFALFAVKGGLYRGGDLYDSQYLLPLAAGLCMFLGGGLFTAANGFLTYDIFLMCVEILLCTLSAFLFHTGMFKYLNHALNTPYTPAESFCFFCLVSLGVLATNVFTIGDFSIGRFLLVLLLLVCTTAKNVAFCTMAGAICGAMMGLADPNALILCAAWGLGCLFASMLSSNGRFFSAFALLFVSGSLLLYASVSAQSVLYLYETTAACLLFLLLPRRSSQFLMNLAGGVATPFPSSHEQKLREYCVMRLLQLSEGFKEVFETVRYVSDRLARSSTKSLGQVIEEASDSACKKCRMCSFCWGKQYDVTMDYLLKCTPALRQKGKLTAEDFPDEMAVRCVQPAVLIEALNSAYSRFLFKKKVSDRFTLGRSLECSQFIGLASTIERMATSLKEKLTFDPEAEQAIFAYLREQEIEPLSVSVLYYESGRPQVEIELDRMTGLTLPRDEFLNELSAICKSPLHNLEIENKNGRARVIATPQELYEPVTCIKSVAKTGETLSGDTASTFRGLAGQFCMALCDAMGSGKRAAIDSAMGIKVLQRVLSAGFDSDMAVRALNASIILNSEEERLTSADIATIDLFTGVSQIVKAGAAPTYIRRGGSVQRLFSRSIPVGILDNVTPEYLSVTLSRGDILVMMSDGVLYTDEGDDFIAPIVRDFTGDNLEDLCDQLLMAAKEKNDGCCPDDMTVMALYLS